MINQSINRSLITAFALVATLGLVAGCSSDASTTAGSGDSSTTVATDGSSTTTPAAGATTLPATTLPGATTPATSPATTTTTDPADALVLRVDGLGPFDYGSAPSAVIDALTAYLGAPARNNLLLYEDLTYIGDGYYTSFDAPYYYSLGFPVGRTTCWTGDFCAEFGGASEADLHFIGWSYSGPPHMLASSSNLTISAQWADFPSMIVHATCYVDGGGTHHGINMVLTVDGGWDWLVSDGGGGYVENLPNPEFTRVTYLWAGNIPFQTEGDC